MKRILQSILILSLFLAGGLLVQGMEAFQNTPEEAISIYPNPTSGPLHISFTTESRLKPDVYIMDMTGNQVKVISEDFTYSVDEFRADVDVSDLKTGIYFIKIEQGQSVCLKKFVVR